MKVITDVIGFTGTIASGKTARCQYLLQLAREYASNVVANVSNKAAIHVHYISADKVGHEIYLPGKPCYYRLIEHFGRGILEAKTATENARSGLKAPDEEPPINRRALGGIVFSDAAKLAELSSITWPFIHDRVREMIEEMVADAARRSSGACSASAEHVARASAEETDGERARRHDTTAPPPRVIVLLEAAILIESGGMLPFCNRVWITYCDRATAIARVMQRDAVAESEAVKRVESQADIARKRELLVEKHYSGEVRTFDTSTLSLEEGLLEMKRSFDTYWQQHVQQAPHRTEQ